MTAENSSPQTPAYSPVQLVTDGIASYLFFVRDGELVCAIANQTPPPSPFPTENLSWVWREPFQGFTVLVDASGVLHCIIQTLDGRFFTATSDDSAMSWSYEREHLNVNTFGRIKSRISG